MLMNDTEYKRAFKQIVSIISSARSRAISAVNAEVITMYWHIGSELNARSVWGSKYIDTLSKDLRSTFPGLKGFSARSLKYMAKFNREVDSELCSSCCTIPWGHIMLLLDKTEPGSRRIWYMHETIDNGWSRAVLDHQIDLHAYERQLDAGKTTNFTRTLPSPQSELAQQALKDPYIFDFITTEQSREERDIEQAMMDNVTNLLLELGTGFAFLGRQFHLNVSGDDFYIDMLFYNTRLHCYVVIELKNEKFKPEFSGKLGFYVAAVDGELCTAGDNPTIGILLCKDKNSTVAEYSLRATDAPIGVSEYRLGDELPECYADVLPSPADLESRI